MSFHQLHHSPTPILIGNVWDVASAQIAEKLNYQAIGTSSGAIATMLGYQDGEEMSFAELEYIVKRMLDNINIPLSVDLEAGYSRDPNQIVNHILKLARMGVVGINIEDSLVEKKGGLAIRSLVPKEEFSESLKQICTQLKESKIDVFINVRTDTFLLGCENPVAETIKRAHDYEAAGADGLFVPCIVKRDDIEAIIKEIQLPLNVMCMPDLPAFDVLHQLGVKRISMGNFVFNKLLQVQEKELQSIQQTNSFQNIFAA